MVILSAVLTVCLQSMISLVKVILFLALEGASLLFSIVTVFPPIYIYKDTFSFTFLPAFIICCFGFCYYSKYTDDEMDPNVFLFYIYLLTKNTEGLFYVLVGCL